MMSMQHFYQKVPGWFSFADVYRDAVAEARDGAVFVEVGSWKGKSAAFMAVEIANSKKSIGFYCVDHWRGSDEPAHHSDADVKAGTLYDAFLHNIKPVAAFIHPIRLPSIEASALFAHGGVDLVLLDGAHDFDSVRSDIAAWLPKIRPGGVLAGDDLNWAGVHRAVDELFVNYEALGTGKGRHWRHRVS